MTAFEESHRSLAACIEGFFLIASSMRGPKGSVVSAAIAEWIDHQANQQTEKKKLRGYALEKNVFHHASSRIMVVPH